MTDAAPPALARWNRAAQGPLALAAVLFLIAYAWPIIDVDLSRSMVTACVTVKLLTWAMFAVDLAVRLTLAPHRWSFLRHNLVDVASVALPMLRPLRLLQLVKLAHVIDVKAENSLRGRVSAYLTAAMTLMIFIASLAVLSAERGHPGANITSFGDAIWWAMTTVTTVGYGDTYPVTVVGRIVAVALMIVGIGTLGLVTAGLASWLMQRVNAAPASRADEAAHTAQLSRAEAHVAELTHEVRRLSAQIADLHRHR